MSNSWNYIIEEWDQTYRCVICGERWMDETLLAAHIDSQLHMNFLRKYGCDVSPQEESNGYYCNLCQHSILNWQFVHDHLTGQLHQLSLNKPPSETCSSVSENSDASLKDSDANFKASNNSVNVSGISLKASDISSNNSDDDLNDSYENLDDSNGKSEENHKDYIKPWDFLVKDFINDDIHCLICGWIFCSFADADDHANGRTHAKAMDSYGHDIVIYGRNSYYCQACKCRIYNFKNVYSHLTGYAHKAWMFENDSDTENASRRIQKHRISNSPRAPSVYCGDCYSKNIRNLYSRSRKYNDSPIRRARRYTGCTSNQGRSRYSIRDSAKVRPKKRGMKRPRSATTGRIRRKRPNSWKRFLRLLDNRFGIRPTRANDRYRR